MSIFSAQGSQTAASKTALTLISAATIRPRLIKYQITNVGAITLDSNFQVDVKRFTAGGTTTAVTPAARDSGDPASVLTAGSNASAEPTYTASTTQKSHGVNPRGSAIWTALEQRDEIIMPATAANGIGFLLVALGGATTVICDADVMQ